MNDPRLAACVLCMLVGCGAEHTPLDVTPGSGGRLQVRTLLGEAGDDQGFSRAEAARAFEFPADHGPHRDFRSEWWYVTVALHAPHGERFGVQFTVFRQALSPAAGDGRWRSSQVYMAHAAITDVARQRHEEWQRIARDRPALAGATAAPFAVWVEDWRFASTGRDFLPLELHLKAGGRSVALTLEADKPLVLQGDAGLSRKGEGQASYYYSFPRLKAAGTLTADAGDVPVHGTAWLDREWSTSMLSSAHSGWDWFALHLEDGSDLMAFQLRRVDGERDPFDAAMWIDANGDAEALDGDRFALSPTRYWTDERSVRWPVAWRLEGDRWREHWLIEAAIDDQRMDTAIEYWEGLVTVKENDGREIGEGYMELTGYALQ